MPRIIDSLPPASSAAWAVSLALAACAGLVGCNTAPANAQPGAAQFSQPLMIRRPTAHPAELLDSARPSRTTATSSNTTASLKTPDRTPQQTGAEASAPACPPEMARVNDVCVDRYEAVLVERGANGEEVPHPAHERPVRGVRYEARSKAGVLPQGYISQVESDAACRNAGKRLCTAGEWFTACRGSKAALFPYGASYQRGKCNSAKPHLLSRWFGRNAREWTYDNFNNPKLDQEPGFLSPTGSHHECASDYGTYDMVGNLHEWVSDRVNPSLSHSLELVDGVRQAVYRNSGHGVFLGGFFSTTAEQGPGCTFTTVGHEPQYHDYSTGFRCCKDL